MLRKLGNGRDILTQATECDFSIARAFGRINKHLLQPHTADKLSLLLLFSYLGLAGWFMHTEHSESLDLLIPYISYAAAILLGIVLNFSSPARRLATKSPMTVRVFFYSSIAIAMLIVFFPYTWFFVLAGLTSIVRSPLSGIVWICHTLEIFVFAMVVSAVFVALAVTLDWIVRWLERKSDSHDRFESAIRWWGVAGALVLMGYALWMVANGLALQS